MTDNLHYSLFSFEELSKELLYEILALRSKIFVVEQNIAYLDIDGNDQGCHHLCLMDKQKLVGYARLLPPSFKYLESAVGRLVIDKHYRGKKLGGQLMLHAVQNIWSMYGRQATLIEAQAQLRGFYESLGFIATTEPYMLEGLMHIKMQITPEKIIMSA